MSRECIDFATLLDVDALRDYFGIHTPAPWVSDDGGFVWKERLQSEMGEVVAAAVPPNHLEEWVHGQSPEVTHEWRVGRMKANARLIAAAPQLLNIYIRLLEEQEEMVGRINRLESIIKEAARDGTVDGIRAKLTEGMSLWDLILLREELEEGEE